jgi:predicted SAM-dependent methyltransferase
MTVNRGHGDSASCPLRLHIGGWEAREGWKILNIQSRPGVDFVGNCRDLSRFADGSVAEIYSSHVYEHLSYRDEVVPALVEAFRVLRPGGLIRIGVPDLEALCRMILDPKRSADCRYGAQSILFGGQTDEFDYHKAGFTFDFLKQFLEGVGFRSVQRVKQFGLFNDTTSMVFEGVPISLNVSAMKPL